MSLNRRVTNAYHRTEQGEHLCLWNCNFNLFFKRIIISFDKTLIHHLMSFKALWSCTETHLDLEPFGSHWSPLYGENPGMLQKPLISFRLKKERHLGWHGDETSTLSAKVFFFFFKKWTPLSLELVDIYISRGPFN